MRIITGIYKGRHFDVPRTFKARPTTDFAKENIFNVLGGYLDFDGITALDLFAGTGSISLEMLSRGCAQVISVEADRDHARFIALMRPVWMYLHRRSFVSNRRKLYAHFHDGKMEAFSFERNRFVFSNQYPIKERQDAVFFLLFIWKQLAMDQRADELYLSGNIREKEELTAMLQKYLSKVTFINPKADFNRAAITDIKGIPLDMVTLYLG